ncbi:alpha-L-fucosidase 1 [Actinidia rufa]|uniref:alpha-L-fucosidase n=1 Tax=Actinidia rufa TaxID=165716 RepID=A0A7J0H426_9ERIC|nr:alpha-L-fucosidase 1 [Actinidia rufa]
MGSWKPIKWPALTNLAHILINYKVSPCPRLGLALSFDFIPRPSQYKWKPRRPPPIPILPIITSPQLQWQLSETALFLHFGPNTFTDSKWGTGSADPASLSAAQWVSVAKESCFSRVILTAKHHDGFCLWPSQYTNYSVRASPWRNENGDVVGVLAAAAEVAGVQLGFICLRGTDTSPAMGTLWSAMSTIWGR